MMPRYGFNDADMIYQDFGTFSFFFYCAPSRVRNLRYSFFFGTFSFFYLSLVLRVDFAQTRLVR
jgi:hypothetical protein